MIFQRFRVSDVLITEYPDPTHTPRGNYCRSFLGALAGINRGEVRWAYERVLTQLNGEVRNAAATHRWTYVGGVVSQYNTHGYCAGGSKWVITFEDSVINQGDKTGTLHPNIPGHSALKNLNIESFSVHNDIQLTGDFMGLEHDQVLFINTDGNLGRVQIVDFSQDPPAQRKYLEHWGEGDVLDG